MHGFLGLVASCGVGGTPGCLCDLDKWDYLLGLRMHKVKTICADLYRIASHAVLL